MISVAGTRRPARPGTSRSATTAHRLRDKSMSNWRWALSGKKFTMRYTAWLALLACKVDTHKWPDSA